MNKQHIIEEIQRTTSENGGKPLGWRKFCEESGIKAYDWGKYRIKWSDAVREAGFEPNQKQGGYGESLLIEKFISLIRELGHYPTASELVFKAHNDSNFPSPKTFRSQFGAKQKNASKILDYCKKSAGYDDVIALCEPLVANQTEMVEKSDNAKINFGYVYLIKSGKSGNTYKIGWSKNSAIRQYQLQTGSPERLNLIHEIKTDDPSGIENYWHRRFADKRIDPNKEWFKLTSDDVKTFKRMKHG